MEQIDNALKDWPFEENGKMTFITGGDEYLLKHKDLLRTALRAFAALVEEYESCKDKGRDLEGNPYPDYYSLAVVAEQIAADFMREQALDDLAALGQDYDKENGDEN